MNQHVIFAAPYLMETTARFIDGASRLDSVDLTLVSQDPQEKLPTEIRQRIVGHWRIDDALDPNALAEAARQLSKRFGPPTRYMATLEQLQVPLAIARESLGISGLSVETAHNFRDKSRMKRILREADVPCAQHALVESVDEARRFIDQVGFPVVVKPPAGAGGKGTYRLDNADDFRALTDKQSPNPQHPFLFEEFVCGTEHSFDSVFIDGKLRWSSVSRYLPSPLEVMENPWIQWCVFLPREFDADEYRPIRDAAERGLRALGLETGLSHMEWFRLGGNRIAISEVGARPPGAQITSLLSYAHDLDFYYAWPRLMVHGEFDAPERHYSVGAAYFRGQGRGRVRRLYGLDEAQQRFGSLVVEAKLPQAGQVTSESYEGDGYVIVRHRDTRVVEEALREIVSLVRVELA